MLAAADPKNRGHVPVLATEAIDAWLTDPAGTYVDGTFGRGGHSRLLLEQLDAAGRVIAMDRDPAAADAAQALNDPRFHFEHTAFSRLGATLDALKVQTVNGVLLDLGVSSPQIDDSQRGFTWRADGPLDMRMDTTRGETAAEWLARASFDEIKKVIRDYGEERFAASIAKALVARREAGRPLAGTADLAAVVAAAIPVASRKDGNQHPATRTFQAVRIHINQELEELALTLDTAARRLVPSGRLVVISFHSLEDRIVKQFIEAHAHPERSEPRTRHLPLTASQLPQASLRAIGKVRASPQEVDVNARSRSAVMRVAERTQVAWTESRR